MITVEIGKSADELVRSFTISGHAGAAPAGEDIICAAISVLGQTSIAAMLELSGLNVDYRIDNELPYLTCKVRLPEESGDHRRITANAIFDTFAIGCEQTSQSYGERYVKIKKKVLK